MNASTPAHEFLRGLHALAEHTNEPIDIAIEHDPPQIRLTAIIGTMKGSISPAPYDGAAWVTTAIPATVKGLPPATPTAFFHRLAHVMPPVSSAGALELNLSRTDGVEGRSRPLDRLSIVMDTYQLTARSSPKPLPKPDAAAAAALTAGMRPILPGGAVIAAAVGRAAAWCATEDDSRFHLAGVLIEADGERTVVVGCNGHRMLVQRVQAPWPFPPTSIHHRVAQALASYLPDAEVMLGRVGAALEPAPDPATAPHQRGPRCAPAHLLIEIRSPLHGTLSLVVKTLDVTYPPWRLVEKPDPEARSYVIGRARMLRATSLGPIVQKKIAHMPMGAKLHEVNEDLLLTMFLVNEHEEHDNAVTDSLGRFGARGQEPVGIDPAYLHDACEVMGDLHTGPGTVTLRLKGPTDPILLDGVRLEGFEPGAPETTVRAIIMPRKL